MSLKVKNWSDFQHYKARRPPWIKLHRSLLDDYQFSRLPLASRALAPCIWLIASESGDGSLTGDPEELAYRLRCEVKDVAIALKGLVDAGFLEGDASNVLAACWQSADSEESREETETEREKNPAATAAVVPGEVVPGDQWNAEAAHDFEVAYSGPPPKQFFAQVKPIARKYGWGAVRPVLQEYLADTPLELLSIPKNLEVRVVRAASGLPATRSPVASKALARTEVLRASMLGGLKGDGTVEVAHDGRRVVEGMGGASRGLPTARRSQ